ncbi:Hemicentin-1 [Mizuhopecten yessoensis]|uniref:Hemicentin-1 n=1 Tax=Mizuhopecten yessoensis TaxID=6573 RepID=A0A210QGJ8_MIZYE|nr:Hemicentin-1 [Mizuhopecten yessoensis]
MALDLYCTIELLSPLFFYIKRAAHPGATEGKCSHGGVNDHGRNTAATGGINKETPDWNWSPHAHLHNISGQTAVRATEAFFMDATSGLLRGIDHAKVKEIFKLKKKATHVSMGFVIDVTGSMANDIRSVKDSMIGKVSAAIGTDNEPTKYVLSTFNDPGSLTTVAATADGKEMIRWIENLTVDGGDDCPEYAISGLLAAIDACVPNSVIYLASDADAKDENMTNIAIQRANAKHIKLEFILTGSCGLSRRRREIQLRQKRGLSAFKNLAAGTGGSVYHIDHSEVTADTASGSLRDIDQATEKNIFKLKKIARRQVSFGYVIDVSAYMADDIRRIKDALITKVSTVIGTVNEPTNYVLSTFSDPANLTKVVTTTDGNEMVRMVSQLTPEGGGDCPDYVMSGIQAAIKACYPYSIIYVATDGDAKDENMTDIVIREAIAKHIRVELVLTATCSSSGQRRREMQMRHKRGLSAFESLAAGTGGSVYHIDHSEVTAVLDHVLEKDFPSSEAIIDYFVQTTSDNDTMDVTVDSEAAVLVITITGPYSLSQAALSFPNGTMQAFPTKLATQYYSSHTITMSIQRPSPGIWKLTRIKNSSWKVNVTASTYMDIDSQLKETDEYGISYVVDRNPIMGKNYTLEVLAYNLNATSTSFSLHLLDEQGTDLFSRPVHITFGSSKITGYISITIPSKNFYVQLSGIDQNGFNFKRMSRKLIKPVGVDLFVQPIFGNLDVGIAQNITYTLSNLGATTQTYTVSIDDDKSRLQSPTSRQHTLLAGNSTGGRFQMTSSVELEYVTYTVSVKLPGSTTALQSSTSTAMFAGAVCSSFVAKKCRQAYTGTNCSLYAWAATAVFSFDVSTYVNVANVSMTIDSKDRKRLHVSGTCCQDNFTVNAKPSAGSGCNTSQRVIALDQEADVVDEITDQGSGETNHNETEPRKSPTRTSGSNTWLIVGVVIGSAAVIVVIATGAIKLIANVGKKRKSKINDSLEQNDYPTRQDNANKPQFNQNALDY